MSYDEQSDFNTFDISPRCSRRCPMRSPEQWRHEAHVAVHSGDAFTVDSFILAVQREAFDAGAHDAISVAEARLRGRLDMRAVGRAIAIDVTKLPNRP